MTRTMFAVPVIITMLVAGLLFAASNPWVSQPVQAADSVTFDSDGVGTVPAGWAMTPGTDLEPGDSFRLVFVTSDARNAQSSNIADYNGFVQTAAARNTLFSSFSSRFRVLASTRGVNARDNSGTTGTGVPIYWVKGAKAAGSYTDFYDGSWASRAGTDENGNTLDSSTQIWTGTNSDGTEHASELGSTFFFAQYASLGASSPFGTSGTGTDSNKHLYGLSPVLKVALGEGADPGVSGSPEPAPEPTPIPTPTPTPTATSTPVSGEPNDGGARQADEAEILDRPEITNELICSADVTIPESVANPGLKADCLALLEIKDDLAKNVVFNWGSVSTPMTDWFGVELGGTPKRVTQLSLTDHELNGNGVDGVIPSKLGDLSGLEILELDHNALTGGIPGSLGNLSNLTELRLQSNKLTGSIPAELGKLTKLTDLLLNDNNLSGRIPVELENLVNLRQLTLGGNNFTGCIPDNLLLTEHSEEVGLPWCNPAFGAPFIDGTAQVGQTLEVDTQGISDYDGLTEVSYSYQWLADDAEIDGATGSTYKVRAEDEGKAIKVRVDFTDDKGNPESLTSEPTKPVVAGGL